MSGIVSEEHLIAVVKDKLKFHIAEVDKWGNILRILTTDIHINGIPLMRDWIKLALHHIQSMKKVTFEDLFNTMKALYPELDIQPLESALYSLREDGKIVFDGKCYYIIGANGTTVIPPVAGYQYTESPNRLKVIADTENDILTLINKSTITVYSEMIFEALYPSYPLLTRNILEYLLNGLVKRGELVKKGETYKIREKLIVESTGGNNSKRIKSAILDFIKLEKGLEFYAIETCIKVGYPALTTEELRVLVDELEKDGKIVFDKTHDLFKISGYIPEYAEICNYVDNMLTGTSGFSISVIINKLVKAFPAIKRSYAVKATKRMRDADKLVKIGVGCYGLPGSLNNTAGGSKSEPEETHRVTTRVSVQAHPMSKAILDVLKLRGTVDVDNILEYASRSYPMTKQQMSNRLTILKNKGLIKNIGRSIWKLVDESHGKTTNIRFEAKFVDDSTTILDELAETNQLKYFYKQGGEIEQGDNVQVRQEHVHYEDDIIDWDPDIAGKEGKIHRVGSGSSLIEVRIGDILHLLYPHWIKLISKQEVNA